MTVEDRAGNTRPSTPLTVTVDTQIAIDHIELVNDSGVPGDNITKHVRPQFQISVPDDVEKVLLSIDGGTTGLLQSRVRRLAFGITADGYARGTAYPDRGSD